MQEFEAPCNMAGLEMPVSFEVLPYLAWPFAWDLVPSVQGTSWLPKIRDRNHVHLSRFATGLTVAI